MPMVYEQESHKCVMDVVRCITSLPLLSSSCSLELSSHALDLTAVRLISRPTLPMSTGLKLRLVLQLMSLLSKRRTTHTLISIRRLLHNHLLMRALARAAAHAERPEQTRGDAEGDAHPHDLQHLVTH